uniref:Uncharacterized protein n=1 Tax=viral metagenome TaxID=1070528 RepID=A0A6M3KY61_9ZZZZ
MTVTIYNPRHKLIDDLGMVLWMPRSPIAPNLAKPDIYAQNAQQLYPLGSKLEFADGRVFRYARWGETATTPTIARLVCNGNLVPGSAATNGYEGSLDATSDVAIGSTTLVLNDTTDRVENWYEDGMLATFPSGHYVEYRIAGSEAATSVDDVTIYLDDPNGLQTLHVVNSTGVTAYPSIFSNVQYMPTTNSEYDSAVGMILADTMTSAYYGWVQRKGRCIVTPTAYFGDSANERMAQMHSDGTIALKAADATHTVGYLTQKTVSGYGDLEIWLTLE